MSEIFFCSICGGPVTDLVDGKTRLYSKPSHEANAEAFSPPCLDWLNEFHIMGGYKFQ
jgi:hypothetical protein